jgi:hypothetical protein
MEPTKLCLCEISGSHGVEYEVQSSEIYCRVDKSMSRPTFQRSVLPHLSSPIGQPVPLDSYITSYLFWLGSLIALMMEAVRTSETSVDIDLTIRQYIPEDSEPKTMVKWKENIIIIILPSSYSSRSTRQRGLRIGAAGPLGEGARVVRNIFLLNELRAHKIHTLIGTKSSSSSS